MRIRLDRAVCQGHGRCYSLAPDLFDCDDEGYSLLKADGDLGPDSEHSAVLAAENCPEYAITIDAGDQ